MRDTRSRRKLTVEEQGIVLMSRGRLRSDDDRSGFALREPVIIVLMALVSIAQIPSLSGAQSHEEPRDACNRDAIFSRPATISMDAFLCEEEGTRFGRMVSEPLSGEFRVQMMELYVGAIGFSSMVDFYEVALDLVDGRSISTSLAIIPKDGALPYSCSAVIISSHPGDFLRGGAGDLALEAKLRSTLAVLRDGDKYRAGSVQRIEELLVEQGPRCLLLCEWAAAVLSKAARGGKPDFEREGLAVAILVSMAEQNRYPAALYCKPLVFREIAVFFEERGDIVSAYAAARFAEQSLDKDDPDKAEALEIRSLVDRLGST